MMVRLTLAIKVVSGGGGLGGGVARCGDGPAGGGRLVYQFADTTTSRQRGNSDEPPPVFRGGSQWGTRKVDVRLPGKGNSNSYGARPVHQIISMIKWIRTSRLSCQ